MSISANWLRSTIAVTVVLAHVAAVVALLGLGRVGRGSVCGHLRDGVIIVALLCFAQADLNSCKCRVPSVLQAVEIHFETALALFLASDAVFGEVVEVLSTAVAPFHHCAVLPSHFIHLNGILLKDSTAVITVATVCGVVGPTGEVATERQLRQLFRFTITSYPVAAVPALFSFH